MSGEAFETHKTEWYWLTLGSGMSVELAEPAPSAPDWTPTYAADHFAAASRPFGTWAARAAPRLNAWFKELASGDWFPIAPLEPESSEVIELELKGPGFASGRIRVSLRRRPSKAALDRFTQEVRAIVLKARQTPAR